MALKKGNLKNLYVSVCMIVLFVLWTLVISTVDVAPAGPKNLTVGLATFNSYVSNIVGVNMLLYAVTDWLGLVPLAFAIGFAILGLIQWIKRGQLSLVDHSILVLGGFYIIVAAMYLFFEAFVINYRPVLINGYLEASYPSSTTMLTMCVMTTAAIQLNTRIKNNFPKRCVIFAVTIFTVFMVIGRFISGVHWVTDIIGGALLSAGLVMMYRFFSRLK